MNQEVNLGVKREIKVIPVDLVQEVKVIVAQVHLALVLVQIVRDLTGLGPADQVHISHQVEKVHITATTQSLHLSLAMLTPQDQIIKIVTKIGQMMTHLLNQSPEIITIVR